MSRNSLLEEKILVADDDRATRFAVSSMLKKAGYAVTAVKDGAEALRKSSKQVLLWHSWTSGCRS